MVGNNMVSKIVYPGVKIGHLEIIERLTDGRYRCICDCGTECIKTYIILRMAKQTGKELFCFKRCVLNDNKYIGLRSRHLEIIKVLDEVVNGEQMCKCRCDCGNIVEKPLMAIVNKQEWYCGDECTCKTRFRDIIGERFGKLVVLGYSHKEKRGIHIYHFYTCKCDCGNTVVVSRSQLLSRCRKSCGCIKDRKSKIM